MLVWKPALALGVHVLDTHHMRMLAMAHAAFAKGRDYAPRAQVVAALRKLADFTAWHFRYEEELMAETGYRDNTCHGEQHSELLGQLERFVKRLGSGSPDLLHYAKTYGFLGTWIGRHIRYSDRPLAAHLIACGWNADRDPRIRDAEFPALGRPGDPRQRQLQ